MLRGDNILCGTTTTGTGTLTLAAVPQPPGAIDFDTWARGIGFGNSVSIPVSYTIIEYTSSSFTNVKGTGKGIGLLNLGASAGIANCTLTRTTPQSSVTGMNGTTPAITIGSSYSIVTAANTLVMIASSALDSLTVPAAVVGKATTLSNMGLGVISSRMLLAGTFGSHNATNGVNYYEPYCLEFPVQANVIRANVSTAYATGAPVSNLYAALYAINPGSNLPGKLLMDYGVLGTSNASLNSTGTIASAVQSGPMLSPGWYWIAYQAAFSGGSTTPALRAAQVENQNLVGIGAGVFLTAMSVTGQPTAFADPAATPTSVLQSNTSSPAIFGLWSS